MTTEREKIIVENHRLKTVVCEHCIKIMTKSFKATLSLSGAAQEVILAIEEKRPAGSFPHQCVGNACDLYRSCRIDMIQFRFRLDKAIAGIASDISTRPLPSLKNAIENMLADLEQAKLELDGAIAQWNKLHPVEA